MIRFLQRRWFLLALVVLIPFGMRIGYRASPDRVSNFPKEVVEVASGLLTALVLLLMSVTLETRKLWHSLTAPGPAAWATAVNFIVIPVMGIFALRFQRHDDFAVGLMVAASVPSTMAAASVWTRKAQGNDAVSLLVTMITNSSCFLITPLWLQLAFWLQFRAASEGDSASHLTLDTGALITKLCLTALTPIIIGQLLRFSPKMRTFADKAKTGFGVAAQVCILALMFWAAIMGGVKLNTPATDKFPAAAAGVVWVTCIVLHLCGMGVAWTGSRLFGFSREDVVGTLFSGSQKTLPIGIFISSSLATQGRAFAVFPILMYHVSQLVLDAMLLDPLARWVSSEPASTTGVSAESTLSTQTDA